MSLKTGFIGDGKVGCSLAAYFLHNGIDVTGIYSRSSTDCFKGNLHYFSDLNKLIEQSDIIFITVTDTAVSDVWSGLDKTMLTAKIICHCSGSLSSDVFSESFGISTASVHPMLAFDSKNVSFDKISKAFFTIEGDETAVNAVSKLLDKCGNTHKTIGKDNKAMYHTAAVFASNFVAAVCYKATEILTRCGFTYEEAELALAPMMSANMDNICKNGVIPSLTGPIERNDSATIEKHLLCMDDEDIALYKELSKVLVKVASIKHPDRNYEELYQHISK